ncbi:Protein MAIN-LIKE 2 [Linum perenne]
MVTALIERWRPETNTFHLVPGEATITLEDVEVLTGLPTTGRPLIVSPDERPVSEICEEWLGVQPPANVIQRRTVRVAWVKMLFDRLPDGATAEVHLLQLIGDPRVASTYSWGSAVLAWLYKWMPYADRTEEFALDGDTLWRSVTPLLCIDCIAWHHPDRCIRQFGFDQRVPQDPEPAGHVKGLLAADFRWSVTDWVAKYQQFVLHWEQRGSHIATEVAKFAVYVSVPVFLMSFAADAKFLHKLTGKRYCKDEETVPYEEYLYDGKHTTGNYREYIVYPAEAERPPSPEELRDNARQLARDRRAQFR